MAKASTDKSTKSATKDANARTKAPKAEKEKKEKRAPSAWNIYMGEHLKTIKEATGKTGPEAMKEVAALWKDAPENPNRGKEPKARKPKAKALAEIKVNVLDDEETASSSAAEDELLPSSSSG
ncbi:hypothetical protein FIBSPDRAFT_954374 [Athelia psychrophila]|uniref:HMG box domain-containing protein n=1 Tax=Athelia psychrophila TaxID=1759441 RepID=A0A166JB08_9AGAM|nr:hypothetical protein FIBSPDRAFT_954374 [Fibularhizoctonia sp. CBS 109695]